MKDKELAIWEDIDDIKNEWINESKLCYMLTVLGFSSLTSLAASDV